MDISYAKFLMQKTKEDYNAIAEEFTVTRRTMWPELRDLDKYVQEGDKVLDIGCGNGKLFGYLISKGKNIFYLGLDVSEKLIKIAQDNYKGKGAEFKAFDGLNIAYPDEYFDKVFCLATLPHLPGEELRLRFLKNIKKTAKPGALMVVTCWGLWQFKFISKQAKMIVNFIRDMILRKGQYDWGDLYIPWHKRDGKVIERYYHAFTSNELRNSLIKSGWEIMEFGYKKRQGTENSNLFAVAKKPAEVKESR